MHKPSAPALRACVLMRIAWQAVAAWRCNPTCSLPLALGPRAVLTALRTPCGARSARHVVSVRVLMTAPCVGATACALAARWAQAPRRIAQSIWICEGQRTAIPQYARHRVGDDCAYQVGAPRARPLSARARTIAACGDVRKERFAHRAVSPCARAQSARAQAGTASADVRREVFAYRFVRSHTNCEGSRRTRSHRVRHGVYTTCAPSCDH